MESIVAVELKLLCPRHAILLSLFHQLSLWEWESWLRREKRRGGWRIDGRVCEWVWLVFLWGVMGGAPRQCSAKRETSQANSFISSSFLLFFSPFAEETRQIERKEREGERVSVVWLFFLELIAEWIDEFMNQWRKQSMEKERANRAGGPSAQGGAAN